MVVRPDCSRLAWNIQVIQVWNNTGAHVRPVLDHQSSTEGFHVWASETHTHAHFMGFVRKPGGPRERALSRESILITIKVYGAALNTVLRASCVCE